MNDVRVSSWLELQDELFGDSWQEALGRHRTSFAYRGRGDAGDDLRTSLARLGGDARELERHIVARARPAPWAADADARLDLLAVRRPAFS